MKRVLSEAPLLLDPAVTTVPMDDAMEAVGSSRISKWTSIDTASIDADAGAVEASGMRLRFVPLFSMEMMRTDDARSPSANTLNSGVLDAAVDAAVFSAGSSSRSRAASLIMRTTAAVKMFWCSRVKLFTTNPTSL
jgi:hypothetical protein